MPMLDSLPGLPGLDAPLSKHDLRFGTKQYNDLPEVSKQAYIDEKIEIFDQLIRLYGLEGHVGIHLAHSHFRLPVDAVLIGTNVNASSGTDIEKCIRRWARPTPIDEVECQNIHGHIYVLHSDGGLLPYEFQDGPAPILTSFNLEGFIRGFCRAVQQMGLQNCIGLEILDLGDINQEPTTEYIVDNVNHILVDASLAKGWKASRTTAWAHVRGEGGIWEFKGNVAYAPPPEGKGHETYTDGKADGKPKTLSEMADALAKLWK